MNNISELEELINLNNKFSKDLNNVDFAGDIVLDQEDVIKIGIKLKNNFSYSYCKDLKSLLLILSVNTAYYYYDEEGFWKHFNELTGLAKNIYDKEYIGNIFEEVLLSKGLITERRFGPFRYVGAILQQIGVTKRNLPSFAAIVKKMLFETSVVKVLEKDFIYYSSFIKKNCFNGYLKKYLLDSFGWNFTNQVIKIIHYLDKNILGINDIPAIKGFHLDFWKNFFNYYFENDAENLEAAEFKKPILFFDPNSNIIYLKYFSDDIKITEPSIFDFEPNSFKGNFAYFLNKVNQFYSKYSGYHLKNTIPIGWEIQGWNIKIKSFAVFDERKGFIESDDLKILPQGTYFIISRIGFTEQLPENDWELINKLNIEDYSFNVYKVVVQGSKKELEQTKIYWQEAPDLILQGNLYEIFFEDLPGLAIENKHLLEGNSEFLLFDIGNGIERITDYENLFELRKAVKDKNAYFGKLWTERLGIFKTSNLSERFNELYFCVIPETEIELPSEIYTTDEQIEFISNSAYLYFDNCDFNKEVRKHIIPPKTDLVEGSIFIRNTNISFHHVINRVDIVINEDTKVKYIDLSINNPFSLKISGVSNLRLEFGINIGINLDEIIVKEVQLNEKGEYWFDFPKIQAKLEKQDILVAKFYIKFQDKILYFNKGVINYGIILQDFSNIEKLYIHKETIHSIDESLFSRINILFGILKNQYWEYDFSLIDTDPIFNTIFIISSILDRSNSAYFKKDNKDLYGLLKGSLLSKEILDVLSWYMEARLSIDENKIENFRILINRFAELSWKPFFDRWENNLLNVLESLNSLSDTNSIISEWALDVFSGKIYKFNSRVANFPGGDLITKAWVKYRENKYIGSLKILKLLKDESKLLNSLKILLKCLIFLKNFRLNSILSLTEILVNHNDVDEITEIIFLIRNISNIIISTNYKTNIDLNLNLIKSMPFLEEDRILLEEISIILNSKDCSDTTQDCMDESSWLTTLVKYKIIKKPKNRKEFFDRIKRDINKIPNSPEKTSILQEFYS